MRKIYSVILLFTFLLGTIQPILPMIEYQLFEGDIIELIGSKAEQSEVSCKAVRCLVNNDCQNCRNKEDQHLLDTDYYPLALKITTIPDLKAFLSSTRFYLPIFKYVTDPIFLPNPPPPQLS